jgi:hypothetical protein
MKNKIRNELKKPTAIIEFRKIGENIEDVKMKLTPFMNLLR